MFSYFSPEDRVPKKHPLRRIEAYADQALKELSPVFDEMYSDLGRPSIPPERLLKSMLLMAPYPVRSDRLFYEMPDYNSLCRWFLDTNLEERSFDASSVRLALGADKGYHTRDLVDHLRSRNIRPHMARIRGRMTPGLDGRTPRHESCELSRRKRKRIVFGWLKAAGGLRKTRFIRTARVERAAHLAVTACNLSPMAKLQPGPG